MIDPDFLKLLCCPETHQDLHLAESALLETLNRQIVSGTLKDRSGNQVSERLEAGLLRADRKFLYPVWNDIPVMLIEQAIPVG